MADEINARELSVWTSEAEELLASWAEKAGCYRWLNDRAEKKYRRRYYLFSIPVIVLSTLTGTANFGMDSYISEENRNGAKAVVGGFNLFAGLLSTLQTFLKVVEQMENHRQSGVAWSKLGRNIQTELALDHNRRSPCHDFLTICRAEYDRLIEQSPLIPDDIVQEFKKKFADKYKHIAHPTICNGLEECIIFKKEDILPHQIESDLSDLESEPESVP